MFRKFVILIHRYLGIPLSGVFMLWFASGIVMIYTGGMPALTADVRIERLPTLDLSSVNFTLADAARIAHVNTSEKFSLSMVLGRPAYRLGESAVFADTGEFLSDFEPVNAQGVVSQFLGVSPSLVSYVDTVTEPDQWTLVERDQLPHCGILESLRSV